MEVSEVTIKSYSSHFGLKTNCMLCATLLHLSVLYILLLLTNHFFVLHLSYNTMFWCQSSVNIGKCFFSKEISQYYNKHLPISHDSYINPYQNINYGCRKHHHNKQYHYQLIIHTFIRNTIFCHTANE